MQRKIAVVGKDVGRALKVIALFASLGWAVEYSKHPSKSDVVWIVTENKTIPEARMFVYDERVEPKTIGEHVLHKMLSDRADIHIKRGMGVLFSGNGPTLDDIVKAELVEDVAKIIKTMGE